MTRVKAVRNAIEERLRKRCVLITWAAAEDAAEAAIEANDAWLAENAVWPCPKCDTVVPFNEKFEP